MSIRRKFYDKVLKSIVRTQGRDSYRIAMLLKYSNLTDSEKHLITIQLSKDKDMSLAKIGLQPEFFENIYKLSKEV